jgi:aspartate/methionine/tyrosine aminotransferase
MYRLAPHARDAVRALRSSRIRAVANAALGSPGVLPFWFGEPDEVTPAFIRDAAREALDSGDTFYHHNLGIAPLRAAIATYVSRLHTPVTAERVVVTSSGVSALMIVTQALVGPGDRVVAITPLWPNLLEQPKILGADVRCVPLRFDAASGWTLDLQRLLDALTPDTAALYVNSPNNPTGWTIDCASQAAILAHCRRHGIWIVADDAYERLYYADDSDAAPAFLALADTEDRLVSVNTFSKSWLMTGWRLGWIVAPEALVPSLGTLVEYNTSCAPGFVQRAGVVAVTGGEPTVQRSCERYRAARDLLAARLGALPGVVAPAPPGAMYLFFRVEGVADSLAFAQRLVAEAKLGLAPGVAFGPEGEGFLRWCFAAAPERIEEGAARLARFLQRDGTSPARTVSLSIGSSSP